MISSRHSRKIIIIQKYIAVCNLKQGQLQEGATIFVFNVFLMMHLMIGLLRQLRNTLFPFLSQNNSGNIFYSFYTKWYVNQYCIFHMVYLFITWR